MRAIPIKATTRPKKEQIGFDLGLLQPLLYIPATLYVGTQIP